MTDITFETATIADAVRRAAKVAPGKSGHAFDKAAGLLFEIDPSVNACMIRATNLDAFHAEVIGVVASSGDPARWRLPSMLLAQVVGGLPPKAGSQVTFTQNGRKITVKQGRMTATMNMMDDDSYPDWELFDASQLTPVASLGQRVGMVEWAATTDNSPPLCGVYLDGTYAVSTDRYKVARVPCKIENLERPILIPSGVLGQVLKPMGETGIGFDGHQFLLAPDGYTWVSTTIYDTEFPKLDPIYAFEYEAEVEVNKTELLEKINRALSYSGADRNPLLKTYWGKREIAVMLENAEVGLFGDVIEPGNGLDHKRVQINFSPKNLTDALNNAPDAKVTIHYDYSTADPREKKTIRVDGGSGYQVWIMKRVDIAAGV